MTILKRVSGSRGDGQGSRWAQHRVAWPWQQFWLEREKAARNSPECLPSLVSVPSEHEGHMSSEGLVLRVQHMMTGGPSNIFSIKVTKSDLHFRQSRLWDTCEGWASTRREEAS